MLHGLLEAHALLNVLKIECGGSFENYSHYKERKFSDWIIETIQKLTEKYEIFDLETASYAKSKHGNRFFKDIDPAKVERECRTYYTKAYHAIKRIGESLHNDA